MQLGSPPCEQTAKIASSEIGVRRWLTFLASRFPTARLRTKTPTGFIPELETGYLINIVQLSPRRRAVPDRERRTSRHRYHPGDAGRRARRALWRPRRNGLHGGIDRGNDLLKSVIAIQSRRCGCHSEHGFGGSTHPPLGHEGCSYINDPAPPVQGIGSAGCFKMMLEDRAG